MKSTIVSICIAVLCVFLFSSCSIAPSLVFFNNSGYTVELRLEEDILNQYNRNFNAIVEHGQSVKFHYFGYQRISIQTETTNWMYCVTNYPPRENYQLQNSFRVQLEATGEVYVLSSSEKLPLKDFDTQPLGYPLKPMTHTSVSVDVLRGIRDIHPERRNVRQVGILEPNAVDLLKRYIQTGKVENYSYVLSENYLRIDGRVIGVVEHEEKGEVVLGLDITGYDTSTTYVTTRHSLIVNKDAELSALLLQAIKQSGNTND